MVWALMLGFVTLALIDFRRDACPVDDSEPILLKQSVEENSKNVITIFRFNGYYWSVECWTSCDDIWRVWARRVGSPFWNRIKEPKRKEFNKFVVLSQQHFMAPKTSIKSREDRFIDNLFHNSTISDRALSKAEPVVDSSRGLSRLTGDDSPESVSA